MVINSDLQKQYKEEGYTVVRGLIPPEELAPLRRRLMELHDGEHDWPVKHFQVLNPEKHKNPKGGYVPVGVQQPASREKIFASIADHPNLVGAMAALLNGSSVKRYTDQALIKDPEIGGESFYHQDSKYWHIGPELGCNSWIALDDVDRGASALAILPGTQKIWEIMEHEEYFDEPTFHSAETGVAFKRHRIPFDKVDFSKEVLLPMSPGDAAFFSNYTWHRAEPNRSGTFKAAYAIAYQVNETE